MFKKKGMLGIGPCYLFEGEEGGSGGAGGAGDDGGAGAGVNGGEGTSGAEGGNSFNFDEFKNTHAKDYLDKPYMKEIDSPEKMFKTIDNLQSLMGKKTIVPDSNASEKDWNDYRERIGLKDSSVYEFGDSHLPDNLKGIHPEGFETKVKDLFHSAAVTPDQAKILQEGYDKLMIDAHGDLLAEAVSKQQNQQILNADFDALADKMWGGEKEAVQNTAKALINEFTPNDLRPHLENLPNDNLVIMASVLKGISDKYISQDDLASLKSSGSSSVSADGLRTQAQEAMTALMSMNPFDKGYSTQQDKVNDLYAQLGKIQGDK